MKKYTCLALLFFLPSLAAYGDFSIGAEYNLVSRTIDFGSLDADSETSDGLAAFIGFNRRDSSSIFYIKHSREETAFDELRYDYEKQQTTFEWHWNRKGAREGNFGNTSAGLYHTKYSLGPDADTDFLGISGGGGFTRFIKGPFFVNGRVKVHLLLSLDEEELFPASGDDEDANSFWGYEAQAAFGLQFGRKNAWSLQVGYRYHDTDFKDRFIDDTSGQAFVVMRFITASKPE